MSKLTPGLLKSLSEQDRREVLQLLEIRENLVARNKIETYYLDAGPLRRELYPRHLEFFAAGAIYRERCALAANRVGKTEGMGGYETALHLTGRYPKWWNGKRFSHPISAWAAGDTSKTTRDIIQEKLLGPAGAHGTGLIPADAISRKLAKPGVPDAVEMVYVKHVAGGVSELGFKSYDQGRLSFQGTAKHLVWYDEEPPFAIYTEGLLRTMTTDGIVMATFTPLLGMSDVVCYFLDIKSEETETV